ncbi:MAG: c-type cytochrome [Chitinophagaceae bacterium]
MIKKFLALSLIVAACYACNNNETKSSSDKDSAAAKPADAGAAADPSKNPDYQKGLALIAGADCLTCHKIDEAATGPAYRDVANKYPNDDATINTLADKIIKGGSGNWGSIPMTAHDALSKDDAKAMVKYILLLKNK